MKITYITSYFVLILFSSCELDKATTVNKEMNKDLKFHVNGEVLPSQNGKVYLYKDNGKKNVLIDSSVVENGLFTFKKNMEYSPQYIGVKFAPDMELGKFPYEFLVDANTISTIKFYAKLNGGEAEQKATNIYSFPLDSFLTDGFYSDSIFHLIVDKYAQVHSSEYGWMSLLRKEENKVKIDSLNQLISNHERNIDHFFDSIIKAYQDNALSAIVLNKLFLRQDFKFKEAMGKTSISDVNKLIGYYDLLSEKVQQIELSEKIKDKINIEKNTATGLEIKNFRSFLQNGDEVHPSDFRGKITLIDFWASWCVPCRKEFPGLREVYEKYNDKGFEIYAISVDDNNEKWIKASKEENVSWINTIQHIDENINGDLFGAPYIPFSMLIDEKGKIIGKNIRKDELEALLAKRIL